MSSLDEKPFPAAALIGAGLLVLTTVVGVGIIQINKHYSPIVPFSDARSGSPAQTRELAFIDEHDGVSVYGGHVRVFDATSGRELPQLRERDGFVRAVLNSLMYERTKRGVAAPPVFELARWTDNRITMSDKSTGARISLGDFGPGNKAVFLKFFGPAKAGS